MNSQRKLIDCIAGCAACCIAPSISTVIPGMPEGKPAGVRCVQLDEHNHCRLFGKAERPEVCLQFQATQELCGQGAEAALISLTRLEQQTC